MLGVIMNRPIWNQVVKTGNEIEYPRPSLRSVVRKSALLNLAIVLTSFPVLVFEVGLKAVVPALVLMAGISVLVWTATFTVFFFVSLGRVFSAPVASAARRTRLQQAESVGVADRWLDGPI
jgi:hypothetical protein